MVRMLLAVGFLLSCGTASQAQTVVSGTVVDDTGALVPGAAVHLTGPGLHRAVTTDSRGEYRFERVPPGTYQIDVALPGFSQTRPRTVLVAGEDVEVPPITLTASLSEVVVVTATKTESPLVDAPATMTVVSAVTLQDTVAHNIGDVLRSVPGVNVIQMSARDVNLTTRQSTMTIPTSGLVLLDGRSINLDFFGMVLWDWVPSNLSEIRQIEVIRGPASAVWGASALTGVVNIITKSPRETLGTTATMSGGVFSRDAGSTAGRGAGGNFGATASFSDAPNSTWSYRMAAGYFASDRMARPVGQIPIMQHPRDAQTTVGGAVYPIDETGAIGASFANKGTKQPRFDARVDQEIDNGRITYAAGIAGTSGIIHSGIGPFDIQSGSHMAYAKVNYRKGTLKLNAFGNFVDAQAPNLLINDAISGQPLALNFATGTYDFEIGHTVVIAGRHVVSYGGNARRNNFDVTIAPTAKYRNEVGGYVQDEFALDRFRLNLGGRLDKFGNIGHPVFSPRLSAIYKVRPDQALRVSYNKAFRAPSIINNYETISIVFPTDLSGLAAVLPPELASLIAAPFPLVIKLVGNEIPLSGTPQAPLEEESLTAYEAAYIGTFRKMTTATAAFYVNDVHRPITFVQLAANRDPYTDAEPPPGWPLAPGILTAMALQGIFLPRTAFTYQNLGPIRQKGIEFSVEHRFDQQLTGFVNYSWQAQPRVLPDPNPYPAKYLALPPPHRVNAGVNFGTTRLLGSASVNHVSKAFWSDVLSDPYHGYSDAYTVVDGSIGMRWSSGKVITMVKVGNVFNADVQQHVFGDILKRSVVSEIRFSY
jgi:outer membrane receptor protein involved in Fe transport